VDGDTDTDWSKDLSLYGVRTSGGYGQTLFAPHFWGDESIDLFLTLSQSVQGRGRRYVSQRPKI